MKNASYLDSFIRHEPGTAIFLGLYVVDGFTIKTASDVMARPLHQELIAMGMSGNFATSRADVLAEFTLTKTQWAKSWQQRLIVKWPGADRAWYQWAYRNTFKFAGLAESSILATTPPSWDEMCPSWAELKVLPRRWRDALRQWRGIYLITDTRDGMQYVGSASGTENVLQRWIDYSKTGHGGNKRLRERQPDTFKFSILERVSPDAPSEEVVKLESSWKQRLLTKWPAGLNEN